MKSFKNTTQQVMDSIRKPIAPPTKVYDPKRKQSRKDIKAGRKNWNTVEESNKGKL
jgi:hypothetical protein